MHNRSVIVLLATALGAPLAVGQILVSSDTQDSILAIDLDGRNVRTLIDLDQALGPADYRPWGLATRDGFLYWSDVEQDSIYRARLDGTGARKIIDLRRSISDSNFYPEGIAVSETAIFWTGAGQQTIYTADRNGQNPRLLLDSLGSQTLGIVATESRIYWTQWGRPTGVFTASNDGTGVRQLTQSCCLNQGIVLTEGKMFWTNGDCVNVASASGADASVLLHVRDLFGEPPTRRYTPYGLTAHAGRLYWADRDQDAIYTTGLDGGSPRKLIEIPDAQPRYITIVPPPTPELRRIQAIGGEIEVEFTGILQQSSDLRTWTDVDPQPTSPHRLMHPVRHLFFRAR